MLVEIVNLKLNEVMKLFHNINRMFLRKSFVILSMKSLFCITKNQSLCIRNNFSVSYCIFLVAQIIKY